MKTSEIKGLKVTDVLIESFGYDATCAVFYQIVKRTSKTVTLRKISSKIVHSDLNSDMKQPVLNNFKGDAFNKRITKYGVKGSYDQPTSLYKGDEIYTTSAYAI